MSDTVLYSPPRQQVVRIFNSEQLIERFEKWMLVVGYSPNTRINYLFSARLFAKFIVGKPITSAKKADVSSFTRCLYEKNLAPTTIQGRLDALRVFFDFLQLGGIVRTSVPREIQRRKLQKRLPQSKSEAEIEQIIAAAITLRDRAIVELLYGSGIRVDECAQLRIEDVDLRARTFLVHGKGNQERLGLFGQKAAEALAAYLGDRKSGPLFLAARESDGVEGLTRRSIGRIVAKVAKRAGIDGVNPHTFRHSFATHLLNRGVDIRFVQQLLGHRSMQTTTVYLHIAIERLQKVHELLEG